MNDDKIIELTDDSLEAVNGGLTDAYIKSLENDTELQQVVKNYNAYNGTNITYEQFLTILSTNPKIKNTPDAFGAYAVKQAKTMSVEDLSRMVNQYL